MAGYGRPKGSPKPPNSGRKAGVPNKSTRDVREAIAEFARANVDQMSEWLEAIPDPARRLDLYLRAIEYHIPKVARTEITGPDGGPVAFAGEVNLRGLSDEELGQMKMLLSKAAQ
ncbi:MAG: hypothetical protein EBS01_16320 [Verrucomicrobia bacterium]|nr:hypothetical protein [Verrucomicrobiota bacterium]